MRIPPQNVVDLNNHVQCIGGHFFWGGIEIFRGAKPPPQCSPTVQSITTHLGTVERHLYSVQEFNSQKSKVQMLFL